ncbi:hypothetical protein C8A00DRAFT_42570 [Chaetomidium leptoderma]|uniref:NAD-dependent epimerase/dehydratase domain-containing protein n=1 Tax=Chaetomidium leptoderma TaxID=669021 RepID=A0AAN6VNV3_9PEZI|nr:hypothetical protein C8A00DRAFT_42570 [Chaetomidium leptoderma]
MSPIQNPVLLPGARVLVTGASGFIGSHIADQLLAGGVIPPMIAGTLNLLIAAARQPDVKRVVITSSCAAAASPKPGVWRTIDTDTWNDEASRDAWAPPPYEAERGFAVYAASKKEMEKEAWTWYREHNPHFVLNTGQSRRQPQDFFVDVQDTARLHVIGLIHPDVREPVPGKTFPRDVEDAELDRSEIVPALRAEALLKDMGRSGWTGLDECMKMNTEDLA